MAFDSLESILENCKNSGKEFWEVIMEDDRNERKITVEESFTQMHSTWDAMLLAAATYDRTEKSASGLVGGDGAKMEEYFHGKEETLCGGFFNEVLAGALEMGESNACMKRIVAAPTAGACGVMPAVLVPYFKCFGKDTDKILKAMYVGAGIGQVIAVRASISGAAGGCQAEIGSASAMTAGALTFLQGGNAEQICHAAAMALKNLLGLVCDPVGGLVEIPCVKRNVIGAVNALAASEMAMAGIVSRIPPDQVIDAMKEIGDKMDSSLRETAKGGLAATPAAIEFRERFMEKR